MKWNMAIHGNLVLACSGALVNPAVDGHNEPTWIVLTVKQTFAQGIIQINYKLY